MIAYGKRLNASAFEAMGAFAFSFYDLIASGFHDNPVLYANTPDLIYSRKE